MRWIPAVLLCALLLLRTESSLSQTPHDEVLSEAAALVRSGEAKQAWQLLAPLETYYAGQPEFDYLLARSALESGQPNRATFILERLLTVEPSHLAARLEMARAHLALGDYERADREFEFLLERAPPGEMRALVEGYRAKTRRAPPGHSGWNGYVEFALGRDTNVSAGATQDSVFVPGLGADFVADPAFKRRPDDFAALGAGAEYVHALGSDLSLIGGADFRHRQHAHVDIFDARLAELHVGLAQRIGARDRMQYVARHSEYALDNTRYRDTQSIATQWSRGLSERARVSAGVQAYRIRYVQEDTKANSSNLLAASASLTQTLDRSARTVGAAALSIGHDNAVAGRADGDRALYGVSLAVQHRLASRVEAYARYSILNSDYKSPNADFGVTRRDRQRDSALGLAWEFSPGWSLRPQLARTVQRSNIPLNEYSRTEISITLRRVWD